MLQLPWANAIIYASDNILPIAKLPTLLQPLFSLNDYSLTYFGQKLQYLFNWGTFQWFELLLEPFSYLFSTMTYQSELKLILGKRTIRQKILVKKDIA